jgi:hypothetical protein
LKKQANQKLWQPGEQTFFKSVFVFLQKTDQLKMWKINILTSHSLWKKTLSMPVLVAQLALLEVKRGKTVLTNNSGTPRKKLLL